MPWGKWFQGGSIPPYLTTIHLMFNNSILTTMNYILTETTLNNDNTLRYFDDLASAIKASSELMAKRLQEWGEDNCEVILIGKFSYLIQKKGLQQVSRIEITKNDTFEIKVQVTGTIELTEKELRRIIELGGDSMMAEVIQRSFSPGGFATLTPESIEEVNGILNTDYDGNFEWDI